MGMISATSQSQHGNPTKASRVFRSSHWDALWAPPFSHLPAQTQNDGHFLPDAMHQR